MVFVIQIGGEGYYGSLKDLFSTDEHNGQFFSTPDRDNDKKSNRNCALMWKGKNSISFKTILNLSTQSFVIY